MEHRTVDLDDEARGRCIEIDDEAVDRLLAFEEDAIQATVPQGAAPSI